LAQVQHVPKLVFAVVANTARSNMGAVASCSGAEAVDLEVDQADNGFPKTRKQVEDGAEPSRGLLWGVSCMQGWRDNMEDAHLALPSLGAAARLAGARSKTKGWDDAALFGVMDGHGGPQVARFVEKHLPRAIAERSAQDVPQALRDAYFEMDDLLRTRTGRMEVIRFSDSADDARGMLRQMFLHTDGIGCTAVNCCVFPDRIVVANVGDSRAVLCRGGQAVDLSKDHKPDDPIETDRIKQAGGWLEVEDHGTSLMYRVNGDLNMSRALGDLEYKQEPNLPPEAQVISAEPDVVTVERQPEDEFMVVACDGIWDVVSSQEGVDFVRKRLGDRSSWPQHAEAASLRLSSICSELLDRCLSPNLDETQGLGGDNMTAIIVLFVSRTSALCEETQPSVVPVVTPSPVSAANGGMAALPAAIRPAATVVHSGHALAPTMASSATRSFRQPLVHPQSAQLLPMPSQQGGGVAGGTRLMRVHTIGR